MNILQVNRNINSGGAAIVAYRLHNYINQKTDSKSYIYCRYFCRDNNYDNIKQFYKGISGRIFNLAISGIEKITGLQYFFQKNFKSIVNNEWFKSVDVVHFHITHGGYINQWFIANVAKYKPVVWTLHDMWAITGRCAHPNDCEKWKIGCGHCEYKNYYPSTLIDTSSFLWNIKRDIYKKININIVTPSVWLYKKLPDSILKHCNSFIIENAVDIEIFKPNNKLYLRKRLNIPKDKFVFLFVAHGGIFNPYKGFQYLQRALLKIYQKKLRPFLIIIGGEKNISMSSLGIEGMFVKTISNELLIAQYYAASDCYICSSTQESFSLTIIESFACQTPTVAFKVGGVPELVEHKKTGYLCNLINENELAKGMEWIMLLSKKELYLISQECRKTVIKKYNLENQVKKYLNLYKSILRK